MARRTTGSAKKAKPEKKKRGRPSQFKTEYCEQVTKLCRLGATDVDLAQFFGVTHTTLNSWKTQHPEFLASLRAGKIEADMQVANSLFKRATGYVVEVEKVIGRGESRKVVKLNVAVEPDTQACMFWLKNRRKEQWRDKQDHEVTGKDGGPIETRQAIDISKLTDEELAAYRLLSAAAARNRPRDQSSAMH